MPEVSYNEVGEHLSRNNATSPKGVFLVYGEMYLVEIAVNTVIDHLLPGSEKAACLETVDIAEGESVYEIIERINTFSFFSQKKVVHLKADSLFAAGVKAEKFLEKIEEARVADDMPKAANLLSTLLAKQQVDLSDITGSDPGNIPGVDVDAYTKRDWLSQVAQYMIENNIAAAAGDSAAVLKGAIEKGFPDNHYLIMTTASLDRRAALYKTINSQHIIVNCAVATGSRKAEQDQQMQVLTGLLQSMLTKHGKKAESGVFKRVYALTGFDPRVFAGNIEKLVHFTGGASHIRVQDVDTILDKSREDPVFALTGALSEKNAPDALYYLSSLLSSGYHYMQLLSAIANHTRKLLMVKLFMESAYGKTWQAGMRFDLFKKQVMPQIVQYDQALSADAMLNNEGDDQDEAKAGKKRKKPAGKTKTADLAIVKNPNNPYPVYQLFLQCDRFDATVLKGFMVRLHDADIRLKTSGRTPGGVLEELVLHICNADARPPEK